MSDPTSFPVAVAAETIMRTVELGVTITDAAVDGDVTVVFATCSPKVASTVPSVARQIAEDMAAQSISSDAGAFALPLQLVQFSPPHPHP